MIQFIHIREDYAVVGTATYMKEVKEFNKEQEQFMHEKDVEGIRLDDGTIFYGRR